MTDSEASDTESQRTVVYCTECGDSIATADSPNAELYDTGEEARESRLNASVDVPMMSHVVLIDFVCANCAEAND